MALPTNIGAISRHDNVVHAKHLLLVANQMLDSCDDTLLLNALDCQGSELALENRVSSKALPVPATPWLTPHGANRGAEVDVGTCTGPSSGGWRLNVSVSAAVKDMLYCL